MDGCFIHIIKRRHFNLRKCSYFPEVPNSTNFIKFKLGINIPLSPRQSSFLARVSEIVKTISKKHMVWVHAQRVVSTGAIVAYEKTIWNRSFNHSPSKTMGIGMVEVSVFNLVPPDSSLPKPAGLCFLYKLPESFFRRLGEPKHTAFFAACYTLSKRIGSAFEVLISLSANGTKACHHKKLTFSFWCQGPSAHYWWSQTFFKSIQFLNQGQTP